MYGLIPALVVGFVEPLSAGGGIAEIKAYLNGSKIPRLLRIRTGLAKCVGLVFSVSSGLAVGKEGPLVHIGAIVAAHVSQGGKFFQYTKPWLRGMRNDHDKRDFISGGAAAGVAAAFGAPIGGVLFALEEASSFWSVNITLRTFFTSMMASFTLNYLLGGLGGDFSKPGLITFGSVGLSGYQLWEIIPFFCIAVMGGIMGACFNSIVIALAKLRAGMPLWSRLVETVILCLFSGACSFYIPTLTSCMPLPGNASSASIYVRFHCPEGSYSDLATLLYNDQQSVILSLFHNATHDFRPLSLVIFFLLYFFLSLVCAGAFVPAGLFVPSIIMGATFGRLVGHGVQFIVPMGWVINPASYALVGVSSMMSGIARMTISLTVMIAETTNNTSFLFPIMMSVWVSKWVGDLFNHSLYELLVDLKRLPFLANNPSMEMDYLVASDVMTKDVVFFDEIEVVKDLVRVLSTTDHNGFPVVNRCRSGNGRTFSGLILRSQICFLLKFKEFVPVTMGPHAQPPGLPAHGPAGSKTPQRTQRYRSSIDVDPQSGLIATPQWTSSKLKWLDFSTSFASLVPGIGDIQLTGDDMERSVDLRPYMHQAPFLVQESFTVTRVFTLFRGLGLRHLCVTDSHSELVGIITRHELLQERAKHIYNNLMNKRREAELAAAAKDSQSAREFREKEKDKIKHKDHHTHGPWSAVAEFQRVQDRQRTLWG